MPGTLFRALCMDFDTWQKFIKIAKCLGDIWQEGQRID